MDAVKDSFKFMVKDVVEDEFGDDPRTVYGLDALEHRCEVVKAAIAAKTHKPEALESLKCFSWIGGPAFKMKVGNLSVLANRAAREAVGEFVDGAGSAVGGSSSSASGSAAPAAMPMPPVSVPVAPNAKRRRVAASKPKGAAQALLDGMLAQIGHDYSRPE